MNDSIVKTIVIENLGEIEKSNSKRIVLRLMEINGNRYLDIRTFSLVNENWEETYKGVTLTKYSFPSFIKLLNEKSEEISEILDPLTPQEFERKLNKNLKVKPKKNKDTKQLELGF